MKKDDVSDDDNDDDDDVDSFIGENNDVVMPVRKSYQDQEALRDAGGASSGRQLLTIDDEFYSPCSISQTFLPYINDFKDL